MPNAIGWAVRPAKHIGYEVLIWSDGVVLHRERFGAYGVAMRVAQELRKKYLPEAFRREEKEVA